MNQMEKGCRRGNRVPKENHNIYNLFLHVSGEEEGLLGSEYYVNNSLYPIENTFVNINLDMIGRTDPTRGYEEEETTTPHHD